MLTCFPLVLGRGFFYITPILGVAQTVINAPFGRFTTASDAWTLDGQSAPSANLESGYSTTSNMP